MCLAVPVLADTMGMASIIQRRQEGADEGGEQGGNTKPVNSLHRSLSVPTSGNGENQEQSWK